MDKIFILTDYKGRFGSKHGDIPYRSGMDLQLLKSAFGKADYEVQYISFTHVTPGDGSWAGRVVLYTSSEDPGLVYKDYIEDVVLALSCAGAEVIPRFEFLRANNNKVFMELLRGLLPESLKGNLVSSHFGCMEEIAATGNDIEFPVVVKGYCGSMGKKVFMAKDNGELMGIIKRKIVSQSTLKLRIKEYLRQIKHRGYQRDSFYRGRFITQKFIPGLKNDWKVYFFGEKAFVFYRPVFPHRLFLASGGGYDNYRYGTDAGVPEGMLDFGWTIFRELRVPNISMDIAWDGDHFYLLEFQCVYFGTAGILKKYSKTCFLKEDAGWRISDNEGSVEQVYADSIAWFLGKGR